MRTVAIIQARRTSTRFPGKVDALLGQRSVIDRVEAQARKIPGVDTVVVAWAHDSQRDEHDVLSRYYDIAAQWHADIIVRVTGDCPFLDPQASGLVLQEFKDCGVWQHAYVSNIYPVRTWPDGLDTEVFSRGLLTQAYHRASDPSDREHVTPWMQRHAVIRSVTLPVDWSWVRLTVDCPEDLVWLTTALQAPRSPAPTASPAALSPDLPPIPTCAPTAARSG